jgi:GntR family transcriptional regulator/MocR family aminotransferase
MSQLALRKVPVVLNRTGPVGEADLPFAVDRAAEDPLHEQIERSVREAVRNGRLAAGSALPSTRGLAADLGVSRGVVSAAYDQLAAEGYLEIRQGAPVRVSRAVRPGASRPPARSILPTFPYDLRPGRPDLAGFPRSRWMRSLRAAWSEAPLDATDLGDPRGSPELRESLAGYLARVRGAAVDPEHMLVTTGFRQGFALVCRWLREHGIERVALEDPGWHPHRLAVEQAGLTIVPVPVDDHGIDVSYLEASGASVVAVTPSHAFPTGAVLSRERRAALIEWSEAADGLILEDDYDSELRFDRGAVGALQGLAPERVVLLGSASKRLAPGLRIGWAVVPSWISWPLVSAKAVEDGGSEVMSQLALSDFIERGELDRHVRRMRGVYAARRAALLRALGRHLPEARIGDDRAGLHELVEVPEALDEHALVDAAAARGVGTEGLSLHRFSGDWSPGLVVGYGGLAEPSLERAVALLAEAARDAV